MVSRSIVFTGGGTAGHVTPNMPLIEEFKKEGWHVNYMGSANSVEQSLVSSMDIPFHTISSGKLRRYFSWQNLIDPFKITWGIAQSWYLLRRLKPDVLFSKGGFVAFPVVFAAWLNRIPVVAHESDMSPGLANKWCFPFVNKLCVNFSAVEKHFKKQNKIIVTGTPIRQKLFQGDRNRALQHCGFNEDKPCLLVIGGSQGADAINRCVRQALPELTRSFQIIHLCGKGKLDPNLDGQEAYKQFEYVGDELADFFALSQLVLSRSGANSLYEILALAKPHVLIPLSKKVSRGDQIQNADYFQQLAISVVLEEEQLSAERLISGLDEVMANQGTVIERIKALQIESATAKIVDILKEQARAQSAKKLRSEKTL